MLQYRRQTGKRSTPRYTAKCKGLTKAGVVYSEVVNFVLASELPYTVKDCGTYKLLQVFGPNEVLEFEFTATN